MCLSAQTRMGVACDDMGNKNMHRGVDMPRKVKQGAKIARYARDRGLSAAALRSYIASGLLRSAILPDGSIDKSVADALLASRTRDPAADGAEQGRSTWNTSPPS